MICCSYFGNAGDVSRFLGVWEIVRINKPANVKDVLAFLCAKRGSFLKTSMARTIPGRRDVFCLSFFVSNNVKLMTSSDVGAL